MVTIHWNSVVSSTRLIPSVLLSYNNYVAKIVMCARVRYRDLPCHTIDSVYKVDLNANYNAEWGSDFFFIPF